MQQPTPPPHTTCIQFCRQKVLCASEPYSPEQLRHVLAMIYGDTGERAAGSFTGYLRFAGENCNQLFLFFFKGAPYAAGRYDEGKPVIYTIQELARQLVKSDKSSLSLTLCETDPVLLKSMLLFLQKEPAIKAPTSLIDLEQIVQQIGTTGQHAMIALRRDNLFNCYFLKNGICAQVHYADSSFVRPDGMSLDEEMLLYAFQPGAEILAYIYRDMNTTVAEDSSQYDQDSLYTLLTVGYLKNKRKSDQDDVKPAADVSGSTMDEVSQPRSSLGITIESGPQQGMQFTVTLPCTIGRTESDLILGDRLVSRRHALLKREGDMVVIEDLGSKNGTKIKGTKIARATVTPDELITIGPFQLRIQTDVE